MRLEALERRPLLHRRRGEGLRRSVEHHPHVVGREHEGDVPRRQAQEDGPGSVALVEALQAPDRPPVGVAPRQRAQDLGPPDDRPSGDQRRDDVGHDTRRLRGGSMGDRHAGPTLPAVPGRRRSSR
jgi:hypothetical protein